MGSILKGRDTDLGRDLAIKVQLESHRHDPEMFRRFVEEAQIGGQLQHPGIVPVYELGALADSRAFFAMKLVQGRTLATLLRQRKDATEDLPRFLGIFEQVCRTMAYAHARGVIHRDLKPSNVMVGSFGEVQVMDWGLAKVLPTGGTADDAAAVHAAGESAVRTTRSGSSVSDSQAGSILGTPGYMSPEQARGEIDQLDERADVFGLGTILCEILTGSPPHVGETMMAIRQKASLGDMTDTFNRLARCGDEQELLALARACLAPQREDRPRDAGEVSRSMTRYLTGVQNRLHEAEFARVEAQARAVEEHKRRRVSMALAGSVVSLVLVVGGAWGWYSRDQFRRSARVASLASEAEVFCRQARADSGDPAKWLAALESIKRRRSLDGGGHRSIRESSDESPEESGGEGSARRGGRSRFDGPSDEYFHGLWSRD